MIKTQDPAVLEGKRHLLEEGSIGFHPAEILQGGSFCLVEGRDVALFEQESEGVYSGHYFFESRGKAAVAVARKFLEYVFRDDVVIRGLTPVENKKALWMTRHLGFRNYGVIPTVAGDMVLSVLTKKEYK